MPGQGRKRTEGDVAPVIEGDAVPASLEELDEPAGREGDELDDDAVEMAEDDGQEDEDEEEGEEEGEEPAGDAADDR